MTTTSRIRVARVVTRMNIGGPAWHVTILSTRLGPEYETRVFVGESDAREGSMLEQARAAGVKIVPIPGLRREPSLIDDLRAVWCLYKYFRRWQPHIVATHMAKAGAVGRVAAFLARVPVRVHTFHGHVLEGYFGRAKTLFYITIERLLDHLTTRFIAISPMLRRDLARIGIGRRRTALIRLGLDLERFTRAAPRGAFRGAIGVPIDRPLVGIVGRLTPIKRHDLFIAMAEHVSRCRPDVLFAIIGDGELWTALNKEVARRGLADRVHFSGWRQDLESVYADLDVLVCCSVNEGTPVSVIEAGAAAKPVVATDVGGVSDVVVDSETGVLVPSGDSGALSEAVLSLLDDPARAAALGSAARRWVLGRYSADRLLGDIRMLYRSLLDRQPISEPIATTAPTTEL